MKLSAAVAAVAADFVAESVTCSVLFGPENDDQHGMAPRIVVSPTHDRWDEPKHPGGNPRPVAVCRAGARAKIWGADYAATEILRNQFVLALHRVASGFYHLEDCTWQDSQGVEVTGRECVLSFTLDDHVEDTPWPNATADVAGAHECVIALPYGDETL